MNTAIYSPSGGSSGIGFAVPVSEVNRVVPQIIKQGRVIRPGLGISVAGRRLSRELGVKGVMIINVQPGSTADKAGLQGTRKVSEGIIPGDIIIAVNDRPVKDYNGLRDELERYRLGETVELTIMRDEHSLKVGVVLEAME